MIIMVFKKWRIFIDIERRAKYIFLDLRRRAFDANFMWPDKGLLRTVLTSRWDKNNHHQSWQKSSQEWPTSRRWRTTLELREVLRRRSTRASISSLLEPPLPAPSPLSPFASSPRSDERWAPFYINVNIGWKWKILDRSQQVYILSTSIVLLTMMTTTLVVTWIMTMMSLASMKILTLSEWVESANAMSFVQLDKITTQVSACRRNIDSKRRRTGDLYEVSTFFEKRVFDV